MDYSTRVRLEGRKDALLTQLERLESEKVGAEAADLSRPGWSPSSSITPRLARVYDQISQVTDQLYEIDRQLG